MAAGRGAIQDDPESWMPVLFLRLKSGSIRWYTRGFQETAASTIMASVIAKLRSGKGVPILGPALNEPLLGSLRALARRWAKENRFPMASPIHDDLPQVAQFVAMTFDPEWPRLELLRHLCDELMSRHREVIDQALVSRYEAGDWNDDTADQFLDDLMVDVWVKRNSQSDDDPYNVLARLPCPIYLTANFDSVLEEAIRRAGHDPKPDGFNWRDDRDDPNSPFIRDPNYKPTRQNPLVYHLFGRAGSWPCVPVTEDEHFAYLLRFGEPNDDAIPKVVQGR